MLSEDESHPQDSPGRGGGHAWPAWGAVQNVI